MPVEKKLSADDIKDKLFAAETLKTNGNITKAYQEIYPKATYHSARVLSSRKLAKVSTQKAIQKLLTKDNVEASVIKQALSKKSPDTIKWSEKHQYLETSLKLKGYLDNKDKGNNTNIAIIIGNRLQQDAE